MCFGFVQWKVHLWVGLVWFIFHSFPNMPLFLQYQSFENTGKREKLLLRVFKSQDYLVTGYGNLKFQKGHNVQTIFTKSIFENRLCSGSNDGSENDSAPTNPTSKQLSRKEPLTTFDILYFLLFLQWVLFFQWQQCFLNHMKSRFLDHMKSRFLNHMESCFLNHMKSRFLNHIKSVFNKCF